MSYVYKKILPEVVQEKPIAKKGQYDKTHDAKLPSIFKSRNENLKLWNVKNEHPIIKCKMKSE